MLCGKVMHPMPLQGPLDPWVLQGAKRPYVAFFGAAGAGGQRCTHAWLSRSTQGLRARLAAPPHCLAFSLPLAGAPGAAAADSRMEAQLAELGQARARTSLRWGLEAICITQ